jgi:hypothetical protein
MPLIASTFEQTNWFRQQFGMPADATINTQAMEIYVPRDSYAIANILEYDGMNGSVQVKQADVILDIYPLSFNQNYTTAEKLADLDLYAGLQSPDGPGMTYAIFSIAASSISPSGCSPWTYDVWSSQPYTRAPWFGFSEQVSWTDITRPDMRACADRRAADR